MEGDIRSTNRIFLLQSCYGVICSGIANYIYIVKRLANIARHAYKKTVIIYIHKFSLITVSKNIFKFLRNTNGRI
jgi:hypothetical protein